MTDGSSLEVRVRRLLSGAQSLGSSTARSLLTFCAAAVVLGRGHRGAEQLSTGSGPSRPAAFEIQPALTTAADPL